MTQFDLLIESIYPQSDSDELAKKTGSMEVQIAENSFYPWVFRCLA